jgi:putative transposase
MNIREEKGHLIAQNNGSVKRINEKEYVVTSQCNGGTYSVHSTDLGWVCACPDHVYRGVKCKHIFAVEFSFAFREQVKKEIIIQPINSVACRYCNSENIVKKALRKNKHNTIQRYLCKDCDRRFSFNIGFDRMHTTPQMITSALQLYFTGESFRNVQKFLKLQGVKISHVAIYKWINKYINLMQSYLDLMQSYLYFFNLSSHFVLSDSEGRTLRRDFTIISHPSL